MLSEIIEFLQTLKVFSIIPADSRGVLLRRGEIEWEVGPGLYWQWPFIDEVQIVAASNQMAHTEEITHGEYWTSLTIRYNIIDAAAALLQEYDLEDSICTIAVEAASWYMEEVEGRPPREGIRSAVEHALLENAEDLGISLISVSVPNVSKHRVVRHLGWLGTSE